MWTAAGAFLNLVPHQGQGVGALCIVGSPVAAWGEDKAEGTALAPPTMIYCQELIKEEFHLIKKLVIKKEPTQEVNRNSKWRMNIHQKIVARDR